MTATEKINSVMLQALLKNARKNDCDIIHITVRLTLNQDGELICEIMKGSFVTQKVTLSDLIGFIYAAAAKGRIKKLLRDVSIEMGATWKTLQVLIRTKDRETICITALKDGGTEKKQLSID